MTTQVYKRQQRSSRQIVQDGTFMKGMYYTSNLIDSATSRLLINYNIRDKGSYVTPRMGLKMDKTRELTTNTGQLRPTDKVAGFHAGFFGVYTDEDGLDKFGDIILSFGTPSSSEYQYYDTQKQDVDSSFRNQVFTNSNNEAFGTVTDSEKNIFPINMSEVGETRLRFYKDTVKPLFTTFNNKLYTIDGVAGEKTGSEEYKFKGDLVKEMRFPYKGVIESFKVTPKDKDTPIFSIDNLNQDGGPLYTVHMPAPMLFLESNGAHNSYDGVKNIFYEDVKDCNFKDRFTEEDILVEAKISTTFLKIPKPGDALSFGSRAVGNYKSMQISGLTELNMEDSSSLDNVDNIGKFSTREDANYITYVAYSGSSAADAVYEFENMRIEYQLKKTIERDLGGANPFEVTENGRLRFNTPRGPFNLDVPLEIKYDRSIFSYDGGIQEYEFVKFNDEFKATPKIIEAKQPKISEATSVGFNMLHKNPYSFANAEGIVIQPLGIMPYKPNSDQEILMSANVGEEIEFEVFYEYAAEDQIYVKWEYLPLSIGPLREPTVVFESEEPEPGGTSFKQVIKANDEKFSLRVTIYPQYEGKRDDARGKVVLYPSYEAGNDYLKDISSYQYNLHNATGIGKYKTMLTLWGVPGAETTLFFSDIDDVSYFPFPNNTVSFNHKVLGTHEYMGGLLVVTTDSLYVIEGDQPFFFEVMEIYQGMTFSPEDVESLKVIKNQIFIRSGSNYYSITPNMYTGDLSDVRLKTVSAPIKELVSNWKEFLQFMSETVFNLDLEWTRRTEVIEYDFFNYLSGDDTIKNVYRFVIKEDQSGSNRKVRHQIDIVLNFHAFQGIWTLETINLPFNEVLPFKSNLYTSYATDFGGETKVFGQKLTYKNSSRKDFYNTASYGYYDNDIETSNIESDLQELPDTVTDTVVRVIDGDTIVTENYGSIRFHYVDAPEDTGDESEEFGPEATQIIRDFLPVGSEVTLEFEGNRSDKYGRVLAWVFNNEGELAQLHLAAMGGVKAIFAFGVRKYTEDIDLAVQRAIDNEVGLWETYEGELETIHTMKTQEILPNYQVLDTGNKNHDPYLTKRYREFQFQISNKSTKNLEWFNRFYINAKPMQDFRDYELYHEDDPKHPDYGTIEVVPRDTSNTDTDAVTFLNSWKLGEHAFPELDIVRIRFKLSGKGTYPRLLMISKNEANYDFLGYSWVMRQMNFR